MDNLETLFEQLTEKEKQQFSETVNLLLGKTYLVYEREADRQYYRFVDKHFELFTTYLEMARWSLHRQKQYAVIHLYNMDERNRRNFNLQETIFLIILRLLYDEKRRDLRLTQQVLVTGQEIQEKYMALQIRRRLPAKEDTQFILKLFNSFSLLDLKKGHWREPEAVYQLYPSLLLVVNPGDLEALVEWIREGSEHEDMFDQENCFDQEDVLEQEDTLEQAELIKREDEPEDGPEDEPEEKPIDKPEDKSDYKPEDE